MMSRDTVIVFAAWAACVYVCVKPSSLSYQDRKELQDIPMQTRFALVINTLRIMQMRL